MKRFYARSFVAALLLFSPPAIAQFECWCAFIQDYTVLQQTNKQIKVSWKADTELGTAKDFMIQRSYSGATADMVDIGYVSANPGASLTSYTFFDAYPCSGTATDAYYRIKSKNTNGDTLFTSIVRVPLNGCPSGCSTPSSPQTCRCNLNVLTGPSTICSGSAVYEVTNASGPVTWSVSSGAATISQTSSTRATVTKVSDGQVTVTAAISGCSNLTKVVTLGTATPTHVTMEYQSSCIGGSDWDGSFIAHPTLANITYLWSIDGGTFQSNPSMYYYYLNQWSNSSVILDFKIQTACGTSAALGGVTYYSPCPGFRAILSPNPGKDHVMVTIEEKVTKRRPLKNDPLEVRIYNFDNSLLLGTQKGMTGSKQLRLNTRMLKLGKYLLHIRYNGETIVQQVLIQ